MLELHLIVLLLSKQPVVWAIPTPILRVGMRVVRKTSQALVPSDGSEVPALGMDDVVYFLLGQLCRELAGECKEG